MKLVPLNDWAVIIPAEAAARTAGGLYIPDTAKEKPEEGVVEAIGPGAYEEEKRGKKKDEQKERKFIPTTVKPGDRVLYERWSGKTHTIGKEERVLVRERDILGFIERTLIPASTASGASTALVERPASLPEKRGARDVVAASAPKAGAKAGKKKSVKKAAKKAAKPAKKKAAVSKKKAAKKRPAGGKSRKTTKRK